MCIKIAKYGLDNFLVGASIGLLFVAFPFFLGLSFALSVFFWFVGTIVLLFFFWFFRDPRRNVPLLAIEDSSIILAPADGKVIEIKEVEENLVLKQKVYQISIFLSPFDVHVNRSPVTGEVFYYSYRPGKFLAAYHPEASEINEHTLIGVKNEFGAIAFKQIA
ncbi:MAG: phosphatidylserine decarboxylase, partial [Candidatus Kapaibacteriota bacterium]